MVLVFLTGLVAWAQDAERFTLVDGRVIVGIYDPGTKLMQAQTTSGVIAFLLEPERIVAQEPYVASAVKSDVVVVSDTKPTRETRQYYLREKRRLDDQVIEDRRALYKEMSGEPFSQTNPQTHDRLVELKQAYDAVGLAFRLEQDSERKRQLGEEWSALDREYSKFLAFMAQAAGARSITRERLEAAEQIYREQIVLLEKGWVRDGYGPPPIR